MNLSHNPSLTKLNLVLAHRNPFGNDFYLLVDNNGDVKWWPTGIFNESLNEVIELRKAQDSK